jgi:hypothetical protein
MRKRPEIPKHLQKKVAKQLLERQKRAGVYEKGLVDAAKLFAAGSAYPVDVAEGFTQGALTPSASYKAAMMRPPVPSDYKIDPKTGKPAFKGKPPAANPEYKGTSEYVGKKLGVDVTGPGGFAPQMLSLDPMAKIHALATLGKLGAGKLAGLGLGASVFGGLKKVGKADDVARPIFTSPGAKAAADISKETIPANKVRSQLEGRGVNKDEMEWTGFNEWIKTKKGEVSKAEIEEFFQQNQIQVREVVRGGKGSNVREMREIAREQTADELYALMTNDEILYRNRNTIEPLIQKYRDGELVRGDIEQLDEWFGSYGHDDAPYIDTYYQEVMGDLESTYTGSGDVKFGSPQWQLPGGENYRELVLMVPPKKVPWTKEDISFLTESNMISNYGENAANFYWFHTPAGLQKVSKKDWKATDFLDDGSESGRITFESPEQVDDFLEKMDSNIDLEDLDWGRTSDNELEVTFNFNEEPPHIKTFFEVEAERFGGKVKKDDDVLIDPDYLDPQITQEQALEEVLTRQPDPAPRYTGGHFEENDVVAHIRFNERVDPDGNKVLFIEEIQGDWAHKGEAEGFYTAGSRAAEKRLGEIGKRQQEIKDGINGIVLDEGVLQGTVGKGPGDYKKIATLKKQKEALMEELRVLNDEEIVVRQKDYGYVPEGPFVTDTHQWTNLALKRMIRWGSDNGFDSIAWVTGRQSADRYNVSKVVDEIEWYDMGKGERSVEIKGIKGVSGQDIEILADKEGIVKVTDIGAEEFKGKHIKDIFGKGLGEKILSENKGVLKGLDLDIGGEYHKLIYDQVLTAQAKKIGKKHGAKVEEGVVGRFDKEVRKRGTMVQQIDSRGEPLGDWYVYDPKYELVIDQKYYKTEAEAKEALDKMWSPHREKVWTMRLTDKLQNASREGLPYYVALPPLVVGGAAAQQRTEAQRQQSKSDAQQILAN